MQKTRPQNIKIWPIGGHFRDISEFFQNRDNNFEFGFLGHFLNFVSNFRWDSCKLDIVYNIYEKKLESNTPKHIWRGLNQSGHFEPPPCTNR